MASLRAEKTFVDLYIAKLRGYHDRSRSKSHTTGIIFGYAKCKMNLFTVAVLFCSSFLIYNGEIDQTAALVVVRSVAVACMVIGEQPEVATNFKKALAAAMLIFGYLDRQPRIGTKSSLLTAGTPVVRLSGKIEVNEAVFQYPTRPDVDVLSGVKLVVHPGEKVGKRVRNGILG